MLVMFLLLLMKVVLNICGFRLGLVSRLLVKGFSLVLCVIWVWVWCLGLQGRYRFFRCDLVFVVRMFRCNLLLSLFCLLMLDSIVVWWFFSLCRQVRCVFRLCSWVLFRLLVIFLWQWVMNGMLVFLFNRVMVVCVWVVWVLILLVMVWVICWVSLMLGIVFGWSYVMENLIVVMQGGGGNLLIVVF